MNVKILNASGESLFCENTSNSVCISKDMISKSEGRLELHFQLPIVDVHGFWKPDLYRPIMQLLWQIELKSSANNNCPYIVFFNRAGINKLAFWLTNHYDDTYICCNMNQQEGAYDIVIKTSVSKDTAPFELQYSNSETSWTNMTGFCRESVIKKTPNYPVDAWRPVYCTWYAVHAALNMEYLESNAKIAGELGFGTFIVDDGWSYSDSKRVTPETVPTWYQDIGNWALSEEKLPNFAEHVKRVQNSGMNYMLWAAPFFVGAKTEKHTDETEFLFEEKNSYGIFNPADRKLSKNTIEQLKFLVKYYKLDGLKLDFLAHVPVDINNPHGRDSYKFIKNLTDEIRKINSNALIEFRHFYSTPLTMNLGTQFRANDTPFDFIENFHRVIQIRMLLGDNVPVHADPVCWHPNEKAENIALHMIASMGGVPMLSMELASLSETCLKLIQYYLKFYNEHLDTFRQGRWSFQYDFDRAVYLMVEHNGQRIVFLADSQYLEEVLDERPLKTYVFNLSNQNISTREFAQVFNCYGNMIAANSIPIAGLGQI